MHQKMFFSSWIDFALDTVIKKNYFKRCIKKY